MQHALRNIHAASRPGKQHTVVGRVCNEKLTFEDVNPGGKIMPVALILHLRNIHFHGVETRNLYFIISLFRRVEVVTMYGKFHFQ